MSEDVATADEASKILSAALQQMDDLVRGDGLDYKEDIQQQIRHHAEELRRLLDMFPGADLLLADVPHNTIVYLRDYLKQSKCLSNGHLDSSAEPAVGNGGSYCGGEATSKIRRDTHSEESENNASQDDVAFFQAELETAHARLLDLEQQLSRNNEKLMKTEEWLQKEQMTRTYLEAHKLELMSDIMELRGRLQNVEKERSEYRERHERLQKQLYELNHSVHRKDRELAELRSRLAKGGSPLLQGGGTGMLDGSLVSGRYFGSLDRHNLLLRRKQTEVEKLKAAVERLMAENEIKERKLDELRKAVHKYQKVEEIILQSSVHGGSSGGGMRGLSDAEGDNGSMSSVNDAASAKAYHSSSHKAGSLGQRSDISSSFLTAATATAGLSYGDGGRGGGGSFSTLAGSSLLASRAAVAQAPAIVHRSNSCEALRSSRITPKGAVESPPESHARGALGGDGGAQSTAYNSLPRDYRNKVKAVGSGGGDGIAAAASASASSGARSKDAYDEETSGDDDVGSSGKEPRRKRNSNASGLKKIFARLKRSSSSEVVGDGFRRGGARATAGPRLGGWSGGGVQKSLVRENPGLPFARWDGNQVADWLQHDLGLAMYVPDCRRWVRCGQQLLDATPHAIDKELRMTNALHRKKLLLAVDDMRSSEADPDGGSALKLAMSSALNFRPEWVTRWLDDVGLPQYKDQFFEARVDGRVLNFLTVEDLLAMKITNALHHASIRRGIEVLRQNEFNLSSLKRRPLPEELADGVVAARAMSPEAVLLWTNHRIMEWLRTIDLSEYAPNLRGSGVHGGLVILEPRFTVDILADLLSIPTAKSLLRRHLASHFASLIGDEAMKKKSETEGNQNLPPLTLNGKVKVKKVALFHKRPLQSVPGIDGELLCPTDDLAPIDVKKEDKKVKDAVAAYKKELTKRDQKKPPRENLAKAITDYTQFSQEVRTMAGLMTTPQSPAAK